MGLPTLPIAPYLSQKPQPPHLTGNKNVTREEGGSLQGLGY